MPCVYIFKKGKNVGKQCGKSNNEYCKAHSSRVLQLSKFPRLVIYNIINQALKFQAKDVLKIMQNMSLTCKEFNHIIEPFWETLYKSLKMPKELDNNMSELCFKSKCYLMLKHECLKCHMPRTLKIYWPFPLRVCPKCFKTTFIDEFSIKNIYCINNFIHDKFITLNNKEYSIIYYLIKDVETKINCKLNEYHLTNDKREIAAKLDLSYDDLFKRSKRFVYLASPTLKEIEKEYYVNLGVEVFRDHLKNLKIYDMFSEPIKKEEQKIYNFKKKKDFDDWYDTFHNFEEIYKSYKKKDYYMFVYNRELKYVNNMIIQHDYLLEDVPNVSDLLEEYKDHTKHIKELEDVFIEIRHMVKTFIKVNL